MRFFWKFAVEDVAGSSMFAADAGGARPIAVTHAGPRPVGRPDGRRRGATARA